MELRPAKPVVPAYIIFLLSASLVYIVLFSALTSTMNSTSMYDHLTDAAQAEQNEAMLDYLRGPMFRESNHGFLSAAEQAHMTDVKEVLDSLFIIYLLSLGIAVGVIGVFLYNKWWSRLDELLGRTLRASGWTLLGICFFLTLAAMLDFTRFWLLFHAVFFPQGNWMFPASSTLITLYPGAFFERVVLRWLMLVTSFGVIAVLLGHFSTRMRRHDQFFTHKYEQKAEKGHKHTKKR